MTNPNGLEDSRVTPSVTPAPATTLLGTAIMLAIVNIPLLPIHVRRARLVLGGRFAAIGAGASSASPGLRNGKYDGASGDSVR